MPTNECSRSGSADYAIGVAYNIGHTQANIATFSPARSNSGMCPKKEFSVLFFQLMLRYVGPPFSLMAPVS